MVAELTAALEGLPRAVQSTGPLLPKQDRVLGEPDFNEIFTEFFNSRVPSLGENEARRQALAHTIRAYRRFHDCAYKPASVAVLALIPPAPPAPIDQRRPDAESESLDYAAHHGESDEEEAQQDSPPFLEPTSAPGWRGKI
jgi:hypothetical protein